MKGDADVDPAILTADDEAARDAELAANDPKRGSRRTQKIKSKGDGNFFRDVRKQSDYNAK